MKTKGSFTIAVCLCAALGSVSGMNAPSVSGPTPDVSGALANDPAAISMAPDCRGSDIVGSPVVNSSGQKVGTVRDLVVDLNTGRISFAVLATDAADRKLAVPAKLLKPKSDAKEFRLAIDGKKLASAPDFAKNDLADKSWAAQTEDYYGSQEQKFPNVAAGGAINEAAGAQPENWARMSDLRSMTVKDSAGQQAGEIKDTVVDWRSGNVLYAVLDTAGILGLEGRFIAIPLSNLTRSSAGGTMTANVTKEQLKSAPGFDAQHWPVSPDAAFAAQVNHFYQAASSASH